METLVWNALDFFSFFQVQAAIKASAAGKAVASEGVEESIIYVRFKAAASEVPTYQHYG